MGEERTGVVEKEGARVELGKADYVRKSGDKRWTYRWSRNLSPRWLQRQTRGGAFTWAPASGAERVEVGAV